MPEKTFVTERLPLAMYLHASGKLHFSHCEDSNGHKVAFVFQDPNGLGDALELAFENGALVAANSLFASQTYLRRKLTAALESRNSEHYANRR